MISCALFNDPEIAMAVFVAYRRSGAGAAVPVGQAIYKTYFNGVVVVPTQTPAPLP
jgi:cell division protein FtsI/penicillin-binding protein 2